MIRTGDGQGFVVGLTGGIGCGKSTVAELFAELGVVVVDTDEISRELTAAEGDAIPAIRRAFGEGYVGSDGALDRAAMRTLVFADAAARRRLEDVLHPMILERARLRLGAADRPYSILVVPLLPHVSAFRALVRRTLLVDCDESVQIERVMRRSGLSESEVRAILCSQPTRAEYLKLADDVIANNRGREELVLLVGELHRRYLQNSD